MIVINNVVYENIEHVFPKNNSYFYGRVTVIIEIFLIILYEVSLFQRMIYY